MEHRGSEVFREPALAADGHHRIRVVVKFHVGDTVGRGGSGVKFTAAIIHRCRRVVIHCRWIGASCAGVEIAGTVVDNGVFRVVARLDIGAAFFL